MTEDKKNTLSGKTLGLKTLSLNQTKSKFSNNGNKIQIEVRKIGAGGVDVAVGGAFPVPFAVLAGSFRIAGEVAVRHKQFRDLRLAERVAVGIHTAVSITHPAENKAVVIVAVHAHGKTELFEFGHTVCTAGAFPRR